jgi:hypothetical protein
MVNELQRAIDGWNREPAVLKLGSRWARACDTIGRAAREPGSVTTEAIAEARKILVEVDEFLEQLTGPVTRPGPDNRVL